MVLEFASHIRRTNNVVLTLMKDMLHVHRMHRTPEATAQWLRPGCKVLAGQLNHCLSVSCHFVRLARLCAPCPSVTGVIAHGSHSATELELRPQYAVYVK